MTWRKFPTAMSRLCDTGASWVGGWLSLGIIVEEDVALKVDANIQSSRSSENNPLNKLLSRLGQRHQGRGRLLVYQNWCIACNLLCLVETASGMKSQPKGLSSLLRELSLMM